VRLVPVVRGAGLSAREVRPVPVHGADGGPVLDLLRDALSGHGPAIAPHPAGQQPAPAVTAALDETAGEDDRTDPVAAVVSTTGSTGVPKHVLLPASALLASAAATHDRLGGSGRWVLAVPAHTVAGVQVAVRSLVAGTRPVVCDLDGGFRPESFAEATATLTAGRPGRRYTSLVPTQLHRLLADPGGTEAVRAYDAILVGGAALDDELRARAEVAGVAVVSTYGMTETCGGCVYDGRPLPGVDVTVEVPAGADPDEPGRVVVAGPVVARGYRHTARGETRDGVRDGVRGEPADAGEGFVRLDGRRAFRTADLGRLRNGLLRLHGRADDVVVSGGVNVSLDAVARVVRGLPGVTGCVAVGLPDPRWGQVVGVLVQVGPGRAGPTEADVDAVTRARLGRASVPRVVARVAELPLAGVGKPDRAAAAALLRQAATWTGSGPEDAGGRGPGHDVRSTTSPTEDPVP
jgi:o-succinylbenzoate---CoA ligase